MCTCRSLCKLESHPAHTGPPLSQSLFGGHYSAGPADVVAIRDVVSILCLEQVKTECPREICVLCRSSLQASASKDEMLLRLGLRPAEPALGAHTGVLEAAAVYESAQCPCPRLEQEAASNAVVIEALRTDPSFVQG
ncbi:hypothetical protein HPB49_005465 [Dermacentor silvarum]|uniref:Uncharacterized protein n=1 Tax=Dermacentor silvarum TaxID=543639 RepID=A0ACB8DB98_DERSI|nr:hypothetical protein HPB49_005465 [Dermacentor silvarum]